MIVKEKGFLEHIYIAASENNYLLVFEIFTEWYLVFGIYVQLIVYIHEQKWFNEGKVKVSRVEKVLETNFIIFF